MILFWIFAILDIILGIVLMYVNDSLAMPVSIMGGVIVAEIVAWTSFHVFFNDMTDYYQAWRYRNKWDLFSWLDGELWEDWKAEWKLSLYHLLVMGSGLLTFILLLKALGG